MTERPILFSGPMVRAILDGRKTQTRRIAKIALDRHGFVAGELDDPADRCPYGRPGDTLWVRETFRLDADFDRLSPKQADRHCRDHQHLAGAHYEADGPITVGYSCWGRLRPSIHMPRWASRLTLRVTDVRCEPLQAITEHDARAEGIDPASVDERRPYGYGFSPRESFRALWDGINGKRAPWSSNPWVWALGFEVVR